MKASNKPGQQPGTGLQWRRIMLNKYTLTFLAFLLWMVFFDQNRISRQWMLSDTIYNLNEEKEDYGKKINEVKGDIYDLERNKEKFAREKYYLHQKGEEVFIMKDDKKKEKTRIQ